MKLKNIIATAAVVACGAAGSASAATFDFVAIADAYKDANGGTEAEFATMQTFSPDAFTDGGITITGMNAGIDEGGPAAAFFDGTDGSGPAGLGVCSTPSAAGSTLSGCSSNGGVDPGDDNITEDEYVDIFFDQLVKVTDLFFYDSVHDPLNGSVLINFDSFNVVDGMLAAADYAAFVFDDILAFDYDGDEFYVGTLTVTGMAAVPLPASMAFLLAGLGGLGLAKRMRKTA